MWHKRGDCRYAGRVNSLPAYRTDQCWTLGSGDVFAALFASLWGIHGKDPLTSARLASRGVASYVDSAGSLPIKRPLDLENSVMHRARLAGGYIYLASPFFTLGQRWVVDEACRCLYELGMDVFSPVHDVGRGPGEAVAPADLAAIDKCRCRIFNTRWTRQRNCLRSWLRSRTWQASVCCFSSGIRRGFEMVAGSGNQIFYDFVTALHQIAWRE